MSPSPTFKNYPLELLQPTFDSPLVDITVELEHLRRTQLFGSTPYPLFSKIKALFHLLESLGSARIEGNRTTIADYIEQANINTSTNEQIAEVTNIEKALNYVDEAVQQGSAITELFIRELQQFVVSGLTREGDEKAGSYRDHQVYISGSNHLPPDPLSVPFYMKELVDFINNEKHPSKYDLIKIALAHHRLGWIHPFGNGNGRTVRLLTYAMLIKYGFNVGDYGRILNPTAVFCCDRDLYYGMLEKADSGTKEGLEAWCTYVLEGILEERKKLDLLTDYSKLKEKILRPALFFAKSRGAVSEKEFTILSRALVKGDITAADVKKELQLSDSQATYNLKKLKERKLLLPIEKGKRKYMINIQARELFIGVIDALYKENLIPSILITSSP